MDILKNLDTPKLNPYQAEQKRESIIAIIHANHH